MAGVLACGSSARQRPITNPLADGAGARTATAVATAPGGGAVGVQPATSATPQAATQETATGRAASLLAEWLTVPERDLRVVRAEAVDWPDGCLGLQQPGRACAQVVTPGYRISFEDGLGARHTVRADRFDRYLWAGEQRAAGRVVDVLPLPGLLTIEAAGTGQRLELRAVRGTAFDLGDAAPAGGARGIGALRVGAAVALAYDPVIASQAGPPAVAWLVVTP